MVDRGDARGLLPRRRRAWFAAEAGCSVGAVQRYFRTKDEVLHFGPLCVVESARRRLDGIRLGGPDGMTFADALRATILQPLPLDSARLGEARAWAAFYARAAVRPDFGEVIAELHKEALGNLDQALRYARGTGEVGLKQDPEALACLILAIIDGLMWAIMLDPAAAASNGEAVPQLAALDAALGLITR
ncbi:TetR family transcriptional regulator C-terminal domain-containing protein [Nonomuraea sp. NPDC049419]|uniref:TetR family transcriptional regulator C-terminal domain-containing protein n=1 Tax=Nonomuraea sp. NPDC049419 TaxID=3155772 RepID=UPI00343E5877